MERGLARKAKKEKEKQIMANDKREKVERETAKITSYMSRESNELDVNKT